MGNGAKKLPKKSSFAENESSYKDTPILLTAWAEGLLRNVSDRLPWRGLFQKATSAPITFDNAPPAVNRITNTSLKYFLLFLNGYFIGIITAVLILL